MITLKSAQKREQKLVRRIRQYSASGSIEKARQSVRLYLHSHAARVAAIHKASKKISMELSEDRINQIASEISPWLGTNEVVRYHVKHKSNGGYRLIYSYDLRNRALQYLFARALEATDQNPTTRCDVKGKGRTYAISHVANLIECGFDHIVVADIKDCYPTFDSQTLPDLLPLPRKVTREIITDRPRNRQRLRNRRQIPQLGYRRPPNNNNSGTSNGNYARGGRLESGLPQGSAASPSVERYLLGSAVKIGWSEAIACCYADNYLSLSTSASDAGTLHNFLQRFLWNHAAGSFLLVYRQTTAAKGFDYLGYRLRAISQAGHRKCWIDLTARNHRKFYESICLAAETDARNGSVDVPLLRETIHRQLNSHNLVSWRAHAELIISAAVSAEIELGGRRIRTVVRQALQTVKRCSRNRRYSAPVDVEDI
ncbi:hypothetical protein ACKTEK_05780 [Tepidamorphus sp. 3E244]|uniref:hypothetical protein n=1 Tax=Tepidamorphus sp. 3E244 TaxID=3385498 RepID=UPI0038FD2116